MGFFDKLKKTFSGNKKEEKNNSVPLEEEKKEQLEPELDSESKEIATKHDEPNDLEPPKEPVAKSPLDTNQKEEPLEEVVEVKLDKTEEPLASKTVTHEEVLENATEEAEAEAFVEKKYDKGLAKTRKTFSERMNELFANFRSVDEDFFEELEETLIGADVGFETAIRISEELKQEVKLKNAKKKSAIQNAIIEKLVNIYESEGIEENNALNLQQNELTIILFVGVNGVGKTTSIGKLAYQYKNEGKKVLLAAADTFRAGAIDQLVVWGERAGVEVVHGDAGGDPASVVFDAVRKAKEQQADILLVDTAGRLQNKVHLMKELEKIKRIIQREVPEAPHEVLLVLDATTGQNAMVQAKQFKETTDVTGLVLTKLDGTAKGGIVLAIRNELHLPVKLVGLGEGIEDLQAFNPTEFVYGLFKGLITIED
ncbi:signal recognition particle-docking protein FtsY [Vagococcus entomophilus]|uniref:Signal recognition particle receptor FtsY n=1 Tax=Vagococcus entomophilus TaxID=1160095 RepID=A0A430AFS4_9ENTE|nr:signal recognition particle-docking protein FtsY [Vagococcus entomophilus]RSU06564.1 signal recognition particle-docking protein FtsY [Vagococcus entomophilus]